MKKQIYSLFLVLLSVGITHKSFAQIPNASFESWTNGNPDGWATTNEGSNGTAGSVVESNNAHDGNHALEMLPTPIQGTSFYLISLIAVGDTNGEAHAFPVSSAPDALHFWYIANFDSSDEIQLVSATQSGSGNNKSGTGTIATYVSESSSVYKEFVANYYYPLTKTADSAFISFELFNPNSSSPHGNTTFIIDDLSFGAAGNNTTAVKDIQNTNVSLEQNYPNPAVNQTNIIYSLQSDSKVTLNIVDILGRTVKTVINQSQTPGRYKAIVDVNDLPSGNYFYQISAGGGFASNMMTVVK